MIYQKNVIYTTCGAVVLLKFVESFGFEKDSEALVVNKLKDDFSFKIRTLSGQEYLISARYNSEAYRNSDSLDVFVQAMFDKWKFIHQEK